MSWLDDLLGKSIAQGGVVVPDRKILNFVVGANGLVSVADNPALGTTDVTIGGVSGILNNGTITLTGADNGKTLVNNGAVTWVLPAATLGLTFRVINAVAGGTTIDASGTDLIEFFNVASSSGGTFTTTDVFASVQIASIAGKWVAVGAPLGTWSAA